MESTKTINKLSQANKILLGLGVIAVAVWAYYYFVKKDKVTTPTPTDGTTPVVTIVNELPKDDGTTPSTEQANADAIAAGYIYGRMAGLPESQAKNAQIVSQLQALGYKVNCWTTSADAYVCKAVKI